MNRFYILFIFCFIMQSFADAQSYNVGHTVVVFNDAARQKRKITTDVYYPAIKNGENVLVAGLANAQFPLVVIGHGFVMPNTAYENIYLKLVAQGYIVALPRSEENLAPDQFNFAKDLAFLVNAFQGQSTMNNNKFTGKVNNKSCVMGHAMGGGCAVLAGLYNTNITTLIALSPAETNPSCIESASRIHIPTLIIAGGNDCVAPNEQNSKPIYNAINASCKSLITIKGGSHCQFASANTNCSFAEGTCTPVPTISRASQQATTMHYLLLWLNYKLKNDCNARFTFEDDLETATDVTYLQNCTVPVVCSAPKNNVTTDITVKSVKLKWKPVSCVFSYELRYKNSLATSWINIGTVGNINSYTLSGLQPGLTYEWSLRTICDQDATVISPWGNKRTFTTATAKTSGLDMADGSDNDFVVVPNPSIGKYNLSSSLNSIKPISIAVYNCIGKKVYDTFVKPKDSEFNFIIDISSEPSGIYIIRINCGNQVDTQRIIKK